MHLVLRRHLVKTTPSSEAADRHGADRRPLSLHIVLTNGIKQRGGPSHLRVCGRVYELEEGELVFVSGLRDVPRRDICLQTMVRCWQP